jgi:pimeloyl-ACP methyl ester carboxylesterase
MIREQALLFGARRSLLGIVTPPVKSGNAAPAVVLLNAGIIHRVGPNRMYVRLARMLASEGHLVVRFDLSGLGDSEPRPDGLPPFAAALADIREVLDSLAETRGISQFVLVGLCSGADQAVVYAGSDTRIVGVVLLDASIPRTYRYYLHHYAARLFRLSSWLNFASGRHPFWGRVRQSLVATRGAALGEPPGYQPRPDLQQSETRTFLEQAYLRATAAGVRILSVFTADLQAQHNYREQLVDAFPAVPFGDRLQLEYFPAADHSFSRDTERDALFATILHWISGGVASGLPQRIAD